MKNKVLLQEVEKSLDKRMAFIIQDHDLLNKIKEVHSQIFDYYINEVESEKMVLTEVLNEVSSLLGDTSFAKRVRKSIKKDFKESYYNAD